MCSIEPILHLPRTKRNQTKPSSSDHNNQDKVNPSVFKSDNLVNPYGLKGLTKHPQHPSLIGGQSVDFDAYTDKSTQTKLTGDRITSAEEEEMRLAHSTQLVTLKIEKVRIRMLVNKADVIRKSEEIIWKKLGLLAEEYFLAYGAKPLNKDRKWEDYGIEESRDISIMIKARGGSFVGPNHTNMTLRSRSDKELSTGIPSSSNKTKEKEKNKEPQINILEEQLEEVTNERHVPENILLNQNNVNNRPEQVMDPQLQVLEMLRQLTQKLEEMDRELQRTREIINERENMNHREEAQLEESSEQEEEQREELGAYEDNMRFARESSQVRRRSSSAEANNMEDRILTLERENDFDITKEVTRLIGRAENEEDQIIDKPAKDIILKGIVTYNKLMDFREWWAKFRSAIELIGYTRRYNQIRYSFMCYMEPAIQEAIRELSAERELTFEEIVRAVRGFYVVNSKSDIDYKREFYNIRKHTSESVVTYYLRFNEVASKAKINSKAILAKSYIEGYRDTALYLPIRRAVDEDCTISQVHAAALKEEAIQLSIRKTDHSNENSLNSNQNYKNKNKNKRFKTNTNNNYPSYSDNRENKNKTNWNSYRSNNNNNSYDRTIRSSDQYNKKCEICKRVHDYRECKKKWKYYKREEIRILRKINKEPLPRNKWPKQGEEISEQTSWVATLLNRVDSNKEPEIKQEATNNNKPPMRSNVSNQISNQKK